MIIHIKLHTVKYIYEGNILSNFYNRYWVLRSKLEKNRKTAIFNILSLF